MSWNKIHRQEQIENYLRGKLSAEEKAHFQRLLLTDSTLADQVEAHRTAEELIFLAGLTDLNKTILEAQKLYQLKRQTRKNRLIAGSVALLGALSVATWVVTMQSNPEQVVAPQIVSKDTVSRIENLTSEKQVSSAPAQQKPIAKPKREKVTTTISSDAAVEAQKPSLISPLEPIEPLQVSLPTFKQEPISLPEKPIIPAKSMPMGYSSPSDEKTSLPLVAESPQQTAYAFYPLLGEYWEYPFSTEGTQIEIFDKSGVLVFATRLSGYSYTDRWDGRRLNGEELPMGTYQYRCTLPDGTEKIGTVTLLR